MTKKLLVVFMIENYNRLYYKMSTYYPPDKSSSNNIKVELDLTNYATKADLKNITHVDVSSFASKTNLASLKTEVDKIDADKLKTVPVDLMIMKSFKCRLIQYCRKYKSIYDESIIFFITNKLSLQLEALSNCDNFTVITILYNNDVLTCSRSVYHVRLTKIPSTVI